MQWRLLSHPLWLFSPCYFFWYLAGFSIHNPLPKICAVAPLWDTYAENLKFFVFMSLKIWIIKKEPTTFVQYFLFADVDITICQQFSVEYVQWCDGNLTLHFHSINVSFRYIIRSSQKDSCWGRGFQILPPSLLLSLWLTTALNWVHFIVVVGQNSCNNDSLICLLVSFYFFLASFQRPFISIALLLGNKLVKVVIEEEKKNYCHTISRRTYKDRSFYSVPAP